MKSSKLIQSLNSDLSKKPTCSECCGSGKIWVGRHWYTSGTQKECSYCMGTGKLYWAKDVTKEDLIVSAKAKLTIEEQKAVGLL